MNSFEFYQLFLAAQRHFTTNSYDFFKYNGKIRCSEKSFDTTKGKYHYEKFASKLANRDKAITFITGNYMYRNVKFISDCSMEPFEALQSYSNQLSYKFSQDIIRYTTEDDPIKLVFSGSKEPIIYLCIIDTIYSGKIFLSYDKIFKNNIVWENTRYNILKYKEFISTSFQLDQKKLQNLRNLVKQNTK